MPSYRCLIVFFIFILFSQRFASSQVSVYGTAGLTYYDANTVSGRGDSGGLTGGIFYNFPTQSRLTAGIDARGSYSPGPEGGSLGLAALRIAFVPRRVRLRPYFEIGGGVVHVAHTSVFHLSSTQTIVSGTTAGALGLVFGLDIRLTDSLDLRAADYGAAAGSSTGAGTGFLNLGLVYHLRQRGRAKT